MMGTNKNSIIISNDIYESGTAGAGGVHGLNSASHTGTLSIANGGTGEVLQQSAIDTLTAISGASEGEVLTRDSLGNAVYLAIPATGSTGGSWILDSSIVDADPGSGNFRRNATTAALTTQLFINDTTSNSIGARNLMLNLSIGDFVKIEEAGDINRNELYEVSATAIASTGYVTAPVTFGSASSTVRTGRQCIITFIFTGAAGEVAASFTTETFTTTLTFDNNVTYSELTQSGALSLTLAGSGNINGKIQILKIITDGTGITYSTDFISGIDGTTTGIPTLNTVGTFFIIFRYDDALTKVIVDVTTKSRLEPTSTKVANYTALVFENVLYDASGGTFTVDAPASPLRGDLFGIKNVTSDITSITVDGNSNNIEDPRTSFSTSATVSVGVDGIGILWQYSGTEWLVLIRDVGVFAAAGFVEKHFFEDTTSFATTSSTFGSASSDTTPSLSAGDYKIEWGWTWNINNNAGDATVRLRLDGSTVVREWTVKPRDSLNTLPEYYFTETTFASAGTHTVDFEVKINSGGTLTIEDFRYALRKVG